MKYSRFHTAIFAAGAFAVLAFSAQAIDVSHSTLGVLGADGYEAQPLGDIPDGAGALPNPINAGENGWIATVMGNGTGTVVTAGSPGPAEGDRYVRMTNAGTWGSGNGYVQRLDISDVAPTDGGDITVRFSFYVDSTPAAQVGSFTLALGFTDEGSWLMLNSAWDKNGVFTLTSQNAAGVNGTIPTDEWLSAEFIYHVVPGGGNDTIDGKIFSQQGAGELFSASSIAVPGDDGTRGISSAVFASDNYNTSYLDGFVSPPSPDTVVSSSNIVVEATAGIGFLSEAGVEHRLQSTPDLVSSNFTDTGAITIGDGGPQILFDPTGTVTTKKYRVVK